MKALLVSDRQDVSDHIKTVLKENGYDLIQYKWIIKALDNIEEIQPDIIILNAEEYPRHWKTLAAFVKSGIGGNDVALFLYKKSELSREDIKKAEELGVKDFSELVSKKSLEVEFLLNKEKEGFIFAKGLFFPAEDYAQFEYKDADYFQDGTYIKYITMINNDKINAFSALVEKEKDDSLGIGLKIEQYYEKEI